MNKIYNFLLYKIKYYIFSTINIFIPKNPNYIYIYDRRYRKDNVWAIKLYFEEQLENSQYTLYYYTSYSFKNKSNIKFVNNKIKSLWFRLRSKYIFYSYEDMPKFRSFWNQKIINTMHGSPIENMIYTASNSKLSHLWKHERTFNYVLVNSLYFEKIIKRIYKTDDSQILTLGYPRNDYLFKRNTCLSKLYIDHNEFAFNVVWMPTWRGMKSNSVNTESNIDFPVLNIKNIINLNEFLSTYNILLTIKPHPIQLELELFEKNYSNIRFIDNVILDKKKIYLYELLPNFDALITDYSSVYFDYLLLNKPIGFTIEDIASYSDKRGFLMENPKELMPGHHINTYNDLENFLKDLVNSNDNYSEERDKINTLANKYKDNNSTKRLFDFLGIK